MDRSAVGLGVSFLGVCENLSIVLLDMGRR